MIVGDHSSKFKRIYLTPKNLNPCSTHHSWVENQKFGNTLRITGEITCFSKKNERVLLKFEKKDSQKLKKITRADEPEASVES